jgi:hypothetical protein
MYKDHEFVRDVREPTFSGSELCKKLSNQDRSKKPKCL